MVAACSSALGDDDRISLPRHQSKANAVPRRTTAHGVVTGRGLSNPRGASRLFWHPCPAAALEPCVAASAQREIVTRRRSALVHASSSGAAKIQR